MPCFEATASVQLNRVVPVQTEVISRRELKSETQYFGPSGFIVGFAAVSQVWGFSRFAVAFGSFCHADAAVIGLGRREKRKRALLGSKLPRNISVGVSGKVPSPGGGCVRRQRFF